MTTYLHSQQFVASLPDEIVKADTSLELEDYEDFVVPFSLYRGKLKDVENIEGIIDQINKAYYYNIPDGCAVLMRRLVEVLLILCFNKHGVVDEIRDGKNYISLQGIIRKAKENQAIDLDRSSKADLDLFKDMGDFSAHRRFYTARLEIIARHQYRYESLVQVLLRKAGIIK